MAQTLHDSIRSEIPRRPSILKLPTADVLIDTLSKKFGLPKDPNQTLCDRLEALMRQQDLGMDLSDSLVAATLKKEMNPSMAELMGTLSQQTDRKRNMEDLQLQKYANTAKKMLRSTSEPTMVQRPSQQLPSTVTGSASFSFGKPVHCKGKFQIPVLQPRDPEYRHIPGGVPTPAVGTYTLHETTFPEARENAGGATGGWLFADHKVFLKSFEQFGRKAVPAFFDHLKIELPHVSRLQITDHIRWLGDYEYEQARKQHHVDGWREERQALQMNPTRIVSFIEAEAEREKVRRWEIREAKRKRAELHQQADFEEARSQLHRSTPELQCLNQQHFKGSVLDPKLRGHPEFKKSPGYTWAHSKEPRDLCEKRFTDLSHVRSSSHMDNPGPGHYIGQEEPSRLLKQAPCYTLHIRHKPPKADSSAKGGPGYDGPEDAWEHLAKDLRATQLVKPKCSFGREAARSVHNSNESYAIRDKSSTGPEVGPGRYEHTTSMVSQF